MSKPTHLLQEATAVGTPLPKLQPRAALASLSLIMLLSSLTTSSSNVALPTLARSFHASFQEVQWIVLAYLLAITTLIVSVEGLVIWWAGNLSCWPAFSFSPPPQFFAARQQHYG